MARRPPALDLRETIVLAGSNRPRTRNDRRDFREETPRKSIIGLREAIVECFGLAQRNRHALPVDGIEAAYGVAQHKIAQGKALQSLEVALPVRRKPVALDRHERLAILDQLIGVRCRQAARKFPPGSKIGWRIVAYGADQCDNPTIALSTEDRRKARRLRRRASDDRTHSAVKIAGPARDDRCRVADVDTHVRFLDVAEAPLRQPHRRLRTTPSGINHKIGSDELRITA